MLEYISVNIYSLDKKLFARYDTYMEAITYVLLTMIPLPTMYVHIVLGYIQLVARSPR